MRRRVSLCLFAACAVGTTASFGATAAAAGEEQRNLPRSSNAAVAPQVPLSGKQAVDLWYNEIQNYNFESPAFTAQPQVSHFTQLVWRGSQQFIGFSPLAMQKARRDTALDDARTWSLGERPVPRMVAPQNFT